MKTRAYLVQTEGFPDGIIWGTSIKKVKFKAAQMYVEYFNGTFKEAFKIIHVSRCEKYDNVHECFKDRFIKVSYLEHEMKEYNK